MIHVLPTQFIAFIKPVPDVKFGIWAKDIVDFMPGL